MSQEYCMNIQYALSKLSTDHSFSGWLKGASPLLTYTVAYRQEMILCQYLYSMVVRGGACPSAFRFLALTDYLLHSYPSFIPHLEPILEYMFVNTFVGYYQQGLILQAEQLRGFRAKWFAKLNHGILYAMKVSILNWLSVDIDSPQPLCESKEQLVTPTYRQGQSSRLKRRRGCDEEEKNLGANPRKMRKVEHRKQLDSSSSTNALSGLSAAQQKLEILKEFSPYQCKQCGKRFGQKRFLDLHTEEEFKDKLQAFRKGQNHSSQGSLPSIQQWVNPNPLPVEQSDCYFFLRQFNYESRDCGACSQPFELSFLKTEEWAYKDCVRVIMGEKDCAMHFSCYEMLLDVAK